MYVVYDLTSETDQSSYNSIAVQETMKKLTLITILMVGLFAPSTFAQSVDEEEQFDKKIHQFGYVSGAAFQCAASGQSQAIEAGVMKAFTGISRLFGTDRAFFYAAAYGAGATNNIDRSQCAEYSRRFQEAMAGSILRQGKP